MQYKAHVSNFAFSKVLGFQFINSMWLLNDTLFVFPFPRFVISNHIMTKHKVWKMTPSFSPVLIFWNVKGFSLNTNCVEC